MRRIDLTTDIGEEASDEYSGRLLTDADYDLLVNEDVEVYRPTGELLLKLCRNRLSIAACKAAYTSLREAARPTTNRGMAAGVIEGDLQASQTEQVVASRTRFRRVKADGTLSNTTHAKSVESGIVGYFDRSARFPYCRLTAYSMEFPQRFAAAMPFLREVDGVFAAELPERYAAQRSFIERTNKDFYIPGTVFTTVTVNRNWQTAVHKDKGDLPEGFGVLSALQAGRYEGGCLVFPRFRVAVDFRSRDVLLCDVHQWHGNTPLRGVGRWERISCVFYYRSKMAECGSASEELGRARKLGTERRKRAEA